MGQLIAAFDAATAPLAGPLAAARGEPLPPVAAALAAAGRTWLGALALHAARGDPLALAERVRPLFAAGNPLDTAAAGIADPAARARLIAAGEALAADLIGPQLAPIASRIASLTAARGDTVADMLALAGPLALGAAARALGRDTAPPAIATLLDSERESLIAGLPPGIRPLLAPVGEAAAEARPPRRGGWLPWAVAAALALALLLGLRGWLAPAARPPAPPPASTPMVTAPDSTTRELVLPDGTMLVLLPGTAAFDLARFLDGTEAGPERIVFEPLQFEDGERRLEPTAAQQVRAVAAVLSAFPLARVTIVGEGGPGDDAAQALAASARRAKAVELELAAAGVEPDRLSSEGRGTLGSPAQYDPGKPAERLVLIAARG